MGLKLWQVDTVIIGRFNPHIISPVWLAKQEIVDEKSVQISFSIDRTVSFQFKTGGVDWLVDFSRLMISTEKVSEKDEIDTADLAAKVVKKLSHTPLTAMGTNFRYRCDFDDWTGRLPRLDDKEFKALDVGGELQAVKWCASIKREKGLDLNVELQVEPVKSSILVSLNFHRPVENADELIEFSKLSEKDYDASRTLIHSLFGQKVKP